MKFYKDLGIFLAITILIELPMFVCLVLTFLQYGTTLVGFMACVGWVALLWLVGGFSENYIQKMFKDLKEESKK